MELFARIRPVCENLEQAVVETLAAALVFSPISVSGSVRSIAIASSDRKLDDFELATRLSMFLWCSTPDDELLELAAAEGSLSRSDELVRQTQRLLADPRHEALSQSTLFGNG